MRKFYLFIGLSLFSLNLFSQSISLPFVEDFESGQNGWTSGGSNSTWTFGTPDKLGLSSAPSGSNAWVLGGLAGSHNNNEDSFVQSPEFDFTALTNAKVSATVAYNLEACCDGVTLQYSIDAGANWTTVNASNNSINWYDDEWNGSTNGTREVSSNVSELAGESSVIFRFYFDSDGSVIRDGFVLDDFSLTEYAAQDLSISSLNLRTSRYLSDSQEISAVVYNGGAAASAPFNLSYEINSTIIATETFNVSIPSFSYDTLSFSTRADLSAEIDYNFRVWSTLAIDNNQENDSLATSISHLIVEEPTLPYEAGFENYFSATGESSVPAISNYEEFELLLEQEGVNQRCYSRSSISMKGNRLLSMDSYSNTQYLISHFDLSSLDANNDNLILSFLANSTRNISVDLRSDSASAWISLIQINTGIVQPYSFNLSDYLVNNGANFSESTQIRFTNPTGSRLNLDAFRLELVGENDLLPLSQNLRNGRYLSNSEQLTVSIFNKGIATQQNFDVFYQINELTPVQETITTAVAGLDTATYTFNSSLDLSTIGDYDVKIWTSLSGDSDQSNDTLSFTVENNTNPIVSLPFLIDFENSPNLFKRGDTVLFGDERRFDFLTSREFGEVQVFTGNNAIEGKSIGVASATQDTNELILNLNLSNFTVINNKLLLAFDFKDLGDLVDPEDKVFIRGNDSETWITLYDWNGSDHYTTINTILNISDSLLVNGQEFSTTTQIKFGQAGNGQLGSRGLVLDNISLNELLTDDVSPIVTDLQSSRSLSNSESLTVTLENNGVNAQQNFNVFYQINSAAVIQESVSATLPALDTLNYTFSTNLDLSNFQEYTIKVWTGLTGDMDQANDTLSITIENVINPAVSLPLTIDFENDSNFFKEGDTTLFGDERRFDFFTANGTGQVQVFESTSSIDNRSLGIASSAQDNNSLILNLNLSDFTVANNKLLFGFDFKDVRDEDDAEDKVFIRGSDNDVWLTLYDWNTNNEFVTTNALVNISDSLQINGQEFSRTTQIKFGQSDNVELNGDGLIIDNLSITEFLNDDLSVLELGNNIESSRNLGETEALIIDIYNGGFNLQQNFEVFYSINGGSSIQETVSTTISSLDTLSYTFSNLLDLSSQGSYNVTVWTGLSGDENTSNDTLSVSIEKYANPVVSLPLTIDFESDSIFFTEGDTTFFGEEGRFDFFSENGRGQVQVLTGSDAIDNKSIGIASSSQDNNSLILNLNMSSYTVGDNKLLFDFDFKSIGDEYDPEDKVFIRGSEDESWITLYDWNSNNNFTTITASLNISDSLLVNGQEFSSTTQIKFGQSDNLPLSSNDGLVIDNISITELFSNDLGVISSPFGSSGLLTSADTLQAAIYNFGASSQQAFDIYYQIDEQEAVREVVNETLNPLDTLQYSFTNLVDFAEEKTYSVKIWTSLTNDAVSENDTLSFEVVHYPLVALPYSEDFGANDGNWQASGTNSSWEYGVPNKLDYDTLQNGNAWVLGGLSGTYNNSEQSYLESPLFDLSNLDSGFFSVEIIYDIESGFDELRVQYSTDQGLSWNNLTTGVSDWFSGDGWTGRGTNKITAVADISELASFEEIKLRFYFESDGSIVSQGAIVDNIKIEAYPREDLKTVASNLASSRSLSDSEYITTFIYNAGINAQQNFDVFYQVNNGTVVQETVTSSVAGLDSLSYTFNNEVDLSQEGVYAVDIWTGLSGDENTSNDTLSVSIEKYANPVVSLPLTIDFESDSIFFTEGDTTFFGEEGRFDFFSENGRGQVQVLTGSDAIDNKSIGIASSSQDNNSLILNLNMSSYTVGDNKLLFDFDFKSIGDEYDPEDKVFIRGSEDESWITLYDWNSNNNFTTITASLNISDSLLVNGQEFSSTTQIKFGQSDNLPLSSNDGLVIDNISITELFSNDLGVISSPIIRSSGSFSSAEDLAVYVYNYGYEPQQGFDIFYQVDNGEIVQENVSSVINANDTIDYTFANKMDLSEEKSYSIKVWTGLMNDGNFENDSLLFGLEHYTVENLPYSEDFENGSGNWISGGVNSSWEFGIPNKLGYDSALNNNAWALGGLNSVYNNNEQSFIESPIISMSSIDSGYFALDINHQLEQGWDDLKVQYSTDLGNTWNDLTSGLYNWYSGDGWTGTSSGQINMIADISSLTSIEELKFRVYFDSDGSVVQSGAIIDNIQIKSYDEVDLILNSYSLATVGEAPGEEESIDVSIFNKGGEFNGAIIEYSLNDQQVYQETLPVIGAFENQSITLSNTLDFTRQCANQLRISIIVENDVNPSDNSIEDMIFTNSDPVADLIIADSITFCLNDGLMQLEAEISVGNWTGTGVTQSGEFDPEIAGEGSHEIFFETYAEGCRNYDSLIVEVEAIISGAIDTSVEGQLTAPQASSYNWLKDGVVLNETAQTIELESSGNYSVELTNEAGCVSVIEAGDVLNSNEKLNSSYYNIYPNPAREYLMISISSQLSDVRAQLYSFEGKLVWERLIAGTELRVELSNRFSGTYILKLVSNEGIATEKIIIF